jgi:hypothetical protein
MFGEDNSPKTLLTELHDVQILTFLEGQGIEFYPFSDIGGARKTFLDDLVERNKLDLRLRLSAHWMMKTGAVLLYLRPTGRAYDIRYYPRDGYRVYKDADGDLQEVFIRYSYPKRSQQPTGSFMGQSPLILPSNFHSHNSNEAWVKIRLTKDTFERWDYQSKPDWDDNKIPDVTAENSLGFIPCVECLNCNNKGEQGKPEYEDLSEEIEDLEDLELSVRTNIRELANNILITSLREEQIFDSAAPQKDSVAYASGYRSAADFKSDNSAKPRRKLKRVIGGFDRGSDGEQGDFISQVQISPLPPNQIAYVEDLSRRLRKALGGRDEREVTYSATEVRSQLGEVLATAAMKEKSLYKYGFCLLLEMAILAEENLYLATGGSLGLATAPHNLNRKIKYRKGPIFAQSAREKLDNSIIGRNNARAGVNQMRCLEEIFPEKSEEERKAMLRGGFPTEYLRDLITTMSMMQNITDPKTGQPLTYSLDLTKYITNALSYGEPDNIDIGTSSTTATLESAAYAAAERTAAKLGFGTKPNSRGGSGNAKQPNAVYGQMAGQTNSKQPTTIDAEQPLPSSTGILNDKPSNSNSTL